jgi:hypothetical protein
MEHEHSNKARTDWRVRSLCIGSVAAACTLLVGCGPADEATLGETEAGSEPVAQSEEALVDCASITPNGTGPDVKKIMELTKSVIKVYVSKGADFGDAIQIAMDILDLGGGSSVDAQIAASNEKLFCLAQALDWRMAQLEYNNEQFAPVSAAFMEAQTVGFSRGSPYDESSHTATVASGGEVMFQRLYSPGDPATDGPGPRSIYNGLTLWKDTLGNHEPDHPDNYVFDWRIGLPRFMRLVAARIAMIGMMDPNFHKNGQWNPELGDGTPEWPGYRGVLTARLQKMIEGVRCGHRDRWVTTGGGSRSSVSYYSYTDVVCADVNTGLNVMTTYTRPDGASCGGSYWPQYVLECLNNLESTTTGIPPVQDSLRRQLLKQMPIFEVQAAIDALHLYTHPAPDLTEAFGRIPINANPGLCLDVPGADPTPGTALQLYGCHGGTAQQFSYDRETETIRNTGLDRCLQVRPITFNFPWPIGTIHFDNLGQGAYAEIAICDPTLDRQKWSYDPQGGIIRSALGTVLDVQWGYINWHSSVWLWDQNNSAAQIWRADHNNEYCYGICNPSCYAQCSGLGPGTGSCMGGCMGGCMGWCMTSWP